MSVELNRKLISHAVKFLFQDGRRAAIVEWDAGTNRWNVSLFVGPDMDSFEVFSDLYVATGYAEGMVEGSSDG